MADLQFPHRSNGFKSKAKNVSATDTGKIADGHDYGGRNGYDVVFGEPPKFIVPSFTSEIDDYSEIFKSFSSSKYCSVPILEFPVHEAENGEVSGGSLSSTFAYSDIFGGLDGDVAVPYEELFGEPKGSRNQCRVPPDSKEEGVSGEIPSKNIWIPVETKSWHQSPAVVPNVSLEESKAETFDSLEKNSFSLSVSSHYLQDGVKQHNMPSQKTNQRNKEDAINGTTHISQPNVVCGFTVDPCAPLLSTGSDQTLPQIIDDLSLTMDFTVESLEEKTRRAMPPNPARNNFLKSSLGSKFPAVEEVPSYVNDQQHLHDSPHDLTCGGDKYNRNGTFLKVSDINLWTEPTRVPPPSRPPPKLVTKWGVSEKLMAANLKASGDKEDLHKPVMIYQHQQFGSASKTYIVEEVASQSSPPFLDVEIDASSAAMKEAMERAAARLKRAKHSMERKRDIKGRENGYIKGRERMGYQIDEENCRNKEDTALEVCEGEDRVTEDCARDERRKAEKTAQVQLELAQESTERNLVKDLRVGREAHEQGNRSGEWKAGEWEETEKKIKAAEEFFEQGKKEKKPNAAIEDCEREAREKKLAAAKDNREYGENVNKLKVAKDAHECKEYEKKSNASEDARQREANEKRLKAAQLAREQEENEEKLKAAQEAWEQKENEKKLQLAQEAREWEENRRELKLAQEACEREENERKQKFAQEVRAQEDNERKLKLAKEACEWEENERKLKLAQEAHERVENDKKLKLAQEAREREEYERKLQLAQEAHEREENERKLKLAQEARELEENERRLKLAQEAREREESERKLKLPQEAREQEENERKLKLAQEACEWEENERKLKFAQEPCEREGNEWKPKQAQEAPEQEESKRKIKLAQEAHRWDENGRKLKLAQEDSKWDKTEKKLDVAQWVRVWEEKNRISKLFQEICKSEGTERKGQNVDEAHEIEKHNKDQQEKLKLQHEREQEKEMLRKIEEKEREREREKDRLAVERATCEAHERTFVEARERAERASSEAQERVSMEAILRAERAAVDRATAEVWERAMERVLSEEAAMEAREWAERSIAERIATALTDRQRKDNDLGEFVGNCAKTNGGMSYNPASSEFEHDLEFLSTVSSNESSQRNLDASNYGLHSIENFQEAEGELSKRHKAKLERQQRTDERAAKALADKKLLDILLQREQAERNRLAETLDADVRRWSRGKEGNLRALLSTLQYILWPESGWQPVPLTDVITDAAVKKAYRKATFCVHPDKVQQRGASIQQKYISEKIFDLLKEAWNKFNSEER